ncbi:molybdate ABC transporter substrate-binding protein [Desulfobacter hydrogenophilus]|uniref:Molybdate ABC transporter substrate-binding protein n=2 Tax=Desulfobacter hydrogenophilus TaxID=2291 RepID=A0A328FAP7_9BACT|nr:molybdate ABC transporter substrate-binding protein [Desulfobacter hydrogenophilus]QBH12051.1 molybdate ABC transporter substrate-binding protein [Desulfobacter hydrogenophilus]RAM00097.1 molybdate ABC transporter substrate-binding protein [Desulfobacter hydrogenophilus]
MKTLNNFGKYKILILCIWICLMSSNVFPQTESKEILVFAGAGMRLPLNEIGKKFENQYRVKVLYDFEGSGRLGNKVLVGQTPDVFIPGSDKWAKILKKNGYIKNYTPLAFHTPVIITPGENSNVTCLNDFSNPANKIVLGDTKACAIGGISTKIFKKTGLDESAMHVRARGVTVKQLVLWIEGRNADAAIVWKADAVQSGKVRIVYIPEEDNIINMIPVCPMAENNPAATAYVNYLLSSEGKEIFNKHGFKVQ